MRHPETYCRRWRKDFFARASNATTEAERIAARIVGDVRLRGDAALFAWAKKLDGVDLGAQRLWISASEARAAA